MVDKVLNTEVYLWAKEMTVIRVEKLMKQYKLTLLKNEHLLQFVGRRNNQIL